MRARPRVGLPVVIALLSLAPIVALGLHVRGVIESQSLANARDLAQATVRLGVQPQLSARALAPPLAPGELERDGVAKVWNRDGVLVYAKDRRLVGRRVPISDGLRSALHGHVASKTSNKVVEVDVPLVFAGHRSPSGAVELDVPYAPRDVALSLAAALLLAWALLVGGIASTSRRLRRHAAPTDLPGRAIFDDRTGQAIRVARRDGDRVAVLLLDVGRVDAAADTLVGDRIAGALRASDSVARLGDDRFAVLLPTVRDAAAALDVADTLRAALGEPFSLDGVALHVEASAGVALYPDHGQDAGTLLQRAAAAMRAAKVAGRGCALYETERDVPGADLRLALERDELELHYQPKVDPASRMIDGVEALVRWRHPTRGVIPPGDFIPLAERTDLMPGITAWVLRAALAQAAAWRLRGLDLAVAVNLSPTSLADGGLVERVAAELGRTAVPPSLLTVELTETAVISDPLRARELLDAVAELGVQVAIDDFGTGHSSPAYLKRLPVDELKIDRAFVATMTTNPDDAAVVRSGVALARDLGLTVVAEGVEDPAALDELARRGCDLVQGYAVSRPLPAAKLDVWIEEAERCGLYTVPRRTLAAA